MADFIDDLEQAFGERIKSDDQFAKLVWGALANVDWQHKDGTQFSITFRNAGDLIADIQGDDDEMAYMKWYCSSPNGVVPFDIAKSMAELNWFWSND